MMSLEQKVEALEARVARMERFQGAIESEAFKWRRDGGVATVKFVNAMLKACGIRPPLTRRY